MSTVSYQPKRKEQDVNFAPIRIQQGLNLSLQGPQKFDLLPHLMNAMFIPHHHHNPLLKIKSDVQLDPLKISHGKTF